MTLPQVASTPINGWGPFQPPAATATPATNPYGTATSYGEPQDYNSWYQSYVGYYGVAPVRERAVLGLCRGSKGFKGTKAMRLRLFPLFAYESEEETAELLGVF